MSEISPQKTSEINITSKLQDAKTTKNDTAESSCQFYSFGSFGAKFRPKPNLC